MSLLVRLSTDPGALLVRDTDDPLALAVTESTSPLALRVQESTSPLAQRVRGLFSPSQLPGLAAWYDAADSNTVLTQVGGATNFVAASSQSLSVASNASLNVSGQDFSVSLWYRPSGGNSPWVIREAVNNQASIFITGGNTAIQAFCYDGTNFRDATISFSHTAGVWYHVIVTFTQADKKIRIYSNNGSPAESVALGADVVDPVASLQIGARRAATFATGDVDEVTFHKRVLTADERTFLYNSGAGRTYAEAPDSLKTNLVSWWSMNAPASGDWLDQHGSNHLTPSASRPTATTGVTFNVAQDGQTVRRWLSRHNPAVFFDQSTLANQPTFTNATTGLTFNGTSSFMDGTSTMAGVFRNKGYGYIFAVAQDTNPTGGSGGHAVLQINTLNGEAGRSALLTRRNDTGFTVIARRLDSDTAVILSGGGSNSNPNLLEYQMRWSAGTLQLFNNGISLVSGSYASSGNTSDTDSNKVAIGQDGGTLDFFPGNIREIIVCNEQLTEGQILATRRYLQRKWGTPALP